ncbi:SixA phosphatase family protein [Agrobacterium tumefaciens]|uniref:SixA phosphatase family protein n=1 Tax=Agrobacterium tumefaciens TaxID=358 RepID=UPI0015742ADE|nr:histidine phosphatase family protein [Agrobacterium tumefaciens]NTD12208.1 histidine phosphatase family protein [Agrobacterium tumefaciens]
MTASSPSRVYLLRHAKAAWAAPGERDFDRGLNEAGFAEAEIIADLAADRRYRPDVLLSSTATRCRQTTQAWQRAFNEGIDIVYIDEMYNARSETYLSLIAAQTDAQSVMLVGHNPTMEATLEAMIGEDLLHAALPSGFPTSGLAVLDHDDSAGNGKNRWRLIDFLSPGK